MKKEIYISLCLFFALFGFSSCYDDEGNYDYKAMSKAEVTGLEENYSKISYQDVLHIEPDVKPASAIDEYAYLWTMNKKYTNTYSKIKTDTICRERILDFPVNLKKGNYDLILKVTNIETGYEAYYTSSLEVTSVFATGFYVLKDMGDYTELDGHFPDGSISENLLEKSLDRKIMGKPTSLGVNFVYSYINSENNEYEKTTTLNVCAGKEVEILNIQDMSEIHSHRSMFPNDVPEENPIYLAQSMFGISYFSDKGCYFSYQAPDYDIMGFGCFGYPVETEGEISPNKNIIFDSQYYLFDEKEGRFLGWDYNGGIHTFMTKPSDKYLPHGIKDKLIYFGRTSIQGGHYNGYALFEDAEDTGKHHLYTLTLATNDYSNPVDTVITLKPESGLNKATFYANNERNAQVIYFVNNNELYMYDIKEESEEKIKPQGLPDDEEITYLSNRYWEQADDKDNNFNYLVIGTSKNGQYKVYMYNMLGGKPIGESVRTLKGEGKVVKLQYTSSKMNGGSANYYPSSF